MAPKVQKPKAKAKAKVQPAIYKRPSTAISEANSQLTEFEKTEEERELEFIIRCNDYNFSNLELDTFWARCSSCGRRIFVSFFDHCLEILSGALLVLSVRLRSIRDMTFSLINSPNQIERICVPCSG